MTKTTNELIAELETVEKTAHDERSTAAAAVRRSIEEGGTTDDPILDFLAWLSPLGHGKALPHYRALAERLRDKKGQLILMIERSEAASGGCVIDLGAPVDERFMLGVLTDDQLVLERVGDGGRLSFPTDGYAESSTGHLDRVDKREGRLRPTFYDTVFYFKTETPMILTSEDGGCFGSPGPDIYSCLGADRDAPLTELTLVIGSEEIEAWCRRGYLHYKEGEPNERRCDLLLRLAAQIGAPINRVRALMSSYIKKRGEALAQLESLERRRLSLRDRIEDPKNEEEPRTLIKQLRDTNAVIAALLERTGELGLSREPVVLRLKLDAAK